MRLLSLHEPKPKIILSGKIKKSGLEYPGISRIANEKGEKTETISNGNRGWQNRGNLLPELPEFMSSDPRQRRLCVHPWPLVGMGMEWIKAHCTSYHVTVLDFFQDEHPFSNHLGVHRGLEFGRTDSHTSEVCHLLRQQREARGHPPRWVFRWKLLSIRPPNVA